MHDQLERAPIGIIEAAPDGTVAAVNGAAADLIGTEPDTPAGEDIRAVFPESVAGSLHEAFAETPPDEQAFEEYYPTIDRWLGVELARTDGTVTVYVRDVSQRHHHERTIDRLRQQLDRMEAIDALVVAVLRDLIGASGRDEIARTVCDRLGGTDLYEFAWVGERDLTDGRLRIMASAGAAEEVLDRIGETLGDGAPGPEERAIASGDTQAVATLAEDESVPRPVRRAAFARGLQSCIAVPMTYGDTVYGVVGIYAARQDAFGTSEQASLETLGAVAGFAINAVRQQSLLLGDTVTELVFEIGDPTTPFVHTAEETGTGLSLTGVIPRGDDALVCYLRVDGPTEPVVDGLAEHGAVTDTRVVRADETGGLLEVELAGDTPVTVLSARGATVRTAEYAEGRGRIVVEVPPDGELRRLAEALDAAFADTEMVSRTDRQRETTTTRAFRSDLRERLTEKQETALRTAYLSDYFTSPRGSTAEEVAAALDITGPTLLYHLRAAQRKLLAAFYDAEPDAPPEGTVRPP